MPLVRTYENLRMEVRKRLGKLSAYLTKCYESYDRLREHINTMEYLYHVYNKIKRSSVNLFGVRIE